MAQRQALASQLVHTAHDLLLSVTAVDAIRSQDQQVVIASDHLSRAFGVGDDEVLHLEVSKCATYTELTINAIMEDGAIRSLDTLAFILATWAVLRVELHPRAVLTGKCCNRVANVGHSQTSI